MQPLKLRAQGTRPSFPISFVPILRHPLDLNAKALRSSLPSPNDPLSFLPIVPAQIFTMQAICLLGVGGGSCNRPIVVKISRWGTWAVGIRGAIKDILLDGGPDEVGKVAALEDPMLRQPQEADHHAEEEDAGDVAANIL